MSVGRNINSLQIARVQRHMDFLTMPWVMLFGDVYCHIKRLVAVVDNSQVVCLILLSCPRGVRLRMVTAGAGRAPADKYGRGPWTLSYAENRSDLETLNRVAVRVLYACYIGLI